MSSQAYLSLSLSLSLSTELIHSARQLLRAGSTVVYIKHGTDAMIIFSRPYYNGRAYATVLRPSVCL